MKRGIATLLLLLLLAAGSVGLAWAQEAAPPSSAEPAPEGAGAQEAGAQAARPARGPLAIGLIAIGAALAVGLTALATGIAQGRIGAAGAGTIAEKPESTGTIILLVAIPETMVILGFVIAIVLVFTL
jgi:V/A-type H+-transporting ATPase subunit K